MSRSGESAYRLVEGEPEAFSPDQRAALDALLVRIWPPREPRDPYRVDFEARTDSRPCRRLHTLWDGATAVAHAESFARTVSLPTGAHTVLALASVCTAPAQRGAGHGRAVTLAAFARVDDGEFPLALFQTPVPEFYRRLGAGVVGNTFCNRLHPTAPGASPWWDETVMIYPANAPTWPREGAVDLRGPGY
ncbi:MAG: GNAT family N-acetyltransferase [Opitutales bacterium]